MNPHEDPQPHRPQTHSDSTLTVMQEGERVIFNLKRHPVGLMLVYLSALVVIGAVTALVFGVLPGLGGEDQNTNIGIAVLVLVVVLALIYSLVATVVYWGNQWIVTSDSLTQITQTGLFHKESSQLSLENLEDVTAEQNGILTHIFGYGRLKVETAGERSKFSFNYCPDPNYYAQQILAAREAMMAGNHYAPPTTTQQQ
jgi:uncharacterized membrane protein YdbT with pleckstrin-like domain